MDDMNAFEHQLADRVVRMAGPAPHFDALEIARTAATQSPKWRFQSMFSATKYVAAGAIVALFGGFLLTSTLHQGPDDGQGPGAASAASVSPTPTDGSVEVRHTLVIDGITLSIEARTGPRSEDIPILQRGDYPLVGPFEFVYPPWWEGPDDLKDGLYISRDTAGSQAAEGMILWTTFPDGQHARACLLDPSAVSSAGELAASVATSPGTDLVSGPADVTVGGQAAKHVVVMVTPDAFLEGVSGGRRTRTLGCGPGYFFGWEADDTGAFWQETVPGDTIGVWIVDVDGTLLFIEAETHADVGPAVEQEIEDIIDSIRFE